MTRPTKPSVTYFCMEYGLSPELTVYSGGLGVLAGDYMKSVGDLRLPVTGIGLLWDEGYTTQLIGDDGAPEDHYIPTSRDALVPVDARFEVHVAGRDIACRVFLVDRYIDSTLYLIEPEDPDDRWITRRLYGGRTDDRVAQELLLGVGGVRLLRVLGIETDVYHFNEGHAVFAGLELIREERQAGASFSEACAAVREKIVFTTHTPVEAGNEWHDYELLAKMGADRGFSVEELEAIGGTPFGMTVAGLKLSRAANGVAELHGETARRMWEHVEGGAPIVPITNGVHAPTWQDARIRAAVVADKSDADRRSELWQAHTVLKAELCDLISEKAGVEFNRDGLLVGFARRAASYKRADLIFGDPERLDAWFSAGRLQLVFGGKAHPADAAGRDMVSRLVEASKRWPENVVFLENYDMHLGAAMTRGADVWLNNPRRPMEASGTSGMKAAMNGVLNLSILDGWWPEGCRHGVTGWRISEVGDVPSDRPLSDIDVRDRENLYGVLEDQVMPRYENDRSAWVGMMLESIAMSSWQFSSDRMVEDYYKVLYAPE